MPFLVRPPMDSTEADDPGRTYIVIEPDHNERTILRDLQFWKWRITRHDFAEEEFIKTLTAIERDVKRRRRQLHAIAGDLHGYSERLTLEQVWEREAERALEEPTDGGARQQAHEFSRNHEIDNRNHNEKVEKYPEYKTTETPKDGTTKADKESIKLASHITRAFCNKNLFSTHRSITTSPESNYLLFHNAAGPSARSFLVATD
ncbi:hypothetical protein ACEQ8H_007288 [Pleosporales sp. CAS-2024a]